MWSYDAYFQYGRTNYTQVYQNEFSIARLTRALDVIDDPRTAAVDPICRSVLDNTDPNCLPYDAFGASPSQGSINYLNVFGVIQGTTTEKVLNANITGSLGEMGFRAPWAEDGVGVNFGIERRTEALELNPDQSFQTGDLAGQGAPTLPVSGGFKVFELFGEVQIPIIQRGFVDELSIGGGYRKSYYEVSNGRKYDTDTYKLSAEFAPIRDIRFRAALQPRGSRPEHPGAVPAPVRRRSTDRPIRARAPSITATDFGCLAQGLRVGQTITPNPAGQYNGLLGGNPNLDPEKATTKTLGVVLRPSFAPRVAPHGRLLQHQAEERDPGLWRGRRARRVHRRNDRVDRLAGLRAHPTRSCRFAVVDLGRLRHRPSDQHVDAQDQRHRCEPVLLAIACSAWARVSSSFVGTYLLKYRNDNGLSEPYECDGYYGPVCSSGVVAASAPMPKVRFKARSTLATPFGLGLSIQSRFVGKVRAETLQDNGTVGGAFNYDPGLRIKSQTYFDLAATYTLFDKVNLRAGVNNVLDNDPPFVTSGNAARGGSNLCPAGPCNGNTYPGTWDALGRFFYLGATIDFLPKRRAPPPALLPLAPPPPPAPAATQVCPDGSVILATDVCPAPPPPPMPAPERG